MLRDPEGIEFNFIRDILSPSAGDVLEVGCGDGRLTGELSSISDSVLGLEPDPASIDKARHLLENGVKLVLGSGESIPLKDNSVDTVVFSLSLHHHPDPGNALTQARRVLKEGGRILVLEPGSGSTINRCFRIIHNEDEACDRAAEAVKDCGARLEGQGSFTSTWQFDDFEEMVGYLYSYFDFEPEQHQVDAMKDIMDGKVNDDPFDIEDSTRWWLLTSASST